MKLEGIISETVRERKTNALWSHLHMELKKKQAHREKIGSRGVRGWTRWVKGIQRLKLPVKEIRVLRERSCHSLIWTPTGAL